MGHSPLGLSDSASVEPRISLDAGASGDSGALGQPLGAGGCPAVHPTPPAEAARLTPELLRAVGEEVALRFPSPVDHTEVVLLDVDPRRVHAYWHIEARELDATRGAAGAATLVLRLRDVSPDQGEDGAEETSFDTDVAGLDSHCYLDLWQDGRAYEAEIGLRDSRGSFVPLARSNVVETPPGGAAVEAAVPLPRPETGLAADTTGPPAHPAPVGARAEGGRSAAPPPEPPAADPASAGAAPQAAAIGATGTAAANSRTPEGPGAALPGRPRGLAPALPEPSGGEAPALPATPAVTAPEGAAAIRPTSAATRRPKDETADSPATAAASAPKDEAGALHAVAGASEPRDEVPAVSEPGPGVGPQAPTVPPTYPPPAAEAPAEAALIPPLETLAGPYPNTAPAGPEWPAEGGTGDSLGEASAAGGGTGGPSAGQGPGGDPATPVRADQPEKPSPLAPPLVSYSSGSLGRSADLLEVNTELHVFGRARPGTRLKIFGRPVALRPDGSFSVRRPLPQGAVVIPLELSESDAPDAGGG